MKKLAILSRTEFENPVFHAAFPEIRETCDKIVVFQDLQSTGHRKYPVNRVLQRHQKLIAEAEGFDAVLSTVFCGAPYFLLQSFAGQIDLFAFDLIGKNTPSGKVFNEFEIAQLELEETVLRDYREKLTLINKPMQVYLEHHFQTEAPAPAQSRHGVFPKTPAKEPLIYLPMASRKQPAAGVRLTAQEYIDWAQKAVMPRRLAGLDLTRYLIVDEGNDFLGLAEAQVATGIIGGGILAIDQKRPARLIFKGQIPAYNDRGFLQKLMQSVGSANRPRYPGFGKLTEYVEETKRRQSRPPMVTVVIVHHNRPEYLNACLAGFAAQSDPDFNLVIVDNGSEQLPSLKGFPDLDIRLVRNLNTYPGHARNLGAEVADGRFLLFFDDDNIPKPNLIARLSAQMPQSGGILSCFRETFLTSTDDPDEVILSAPSLKNVSALRNYLGDVVFMIDRATFRGIRFSDYYRVGREDFEFINAALAKGLKSRVVPEALYFYRLGNGDKIGSRHLTHKTGARRGMDFGSFRKYRRAEGSYSAAKVFQLLENYHVDLAETAVRNRKKSSIRFWHPQHGLIGVLTKRMGRQLRKNEVARWVYFKWLANSKLPFLCRSSQAIARRI